MIGGCELAFRFANRTRVTSSTDLLCDEWSDWFPIADGAAYSAVIRPRSVPSGMEVYLVGQKAIIDPNEPDAPGVLGAAVTSAIPSGRTGTISATGHAWGRVGIGWKRDTGTTLVVGEAGGEVSIQQCRKLAGSRSFELPPVLTAGAGVDDARIALLARRITTAGLARLKGTLKAKNLLNYADVRTVFLYRVYNNPDAPGSWSLLEAGWDTPSAANDSRNTGECTPSLSGYMWVDVAVAVRRHTGGSTVSGDFDAAIFLVK